MRNLNMVTIEQSPLTATKEEPVQQWRSSTVIPWYPEDWFQASLPFQHQRMVQVPYKKWCLVQSFSCVQLFATTWTAVHQASLSITNSRSLFKLMSIESVMPSNDIILSHPLLLLPSIFPIIRVFSKESALLIRWPKYWSFSFSISPSNKYSGLISFRTDWFLSAIC